MSNKININQEFALKVRTGRIEGKLQKYVLYNDFKKVLKRVIDNVVDRCVDEASLKGREYNANKDEITDITAEIGGSCYWHGHPEDQPIPDLTVEVDKSSILKIKEQIEYE